jgi:hypothetical protein
VRVLFIEIFTVHCHERRIQWFFFFSIEVVELLLSSIELNEETVQFVLRKLKSESLFLFVAVIVVGQHTLFCCLWSTGRKRQTEYQKKKKKWQKMEERIFLQHT